nr:MAG TPA: hypothetical protein [Caudoviricetes sp.]
MTKKLNYFRFYSSAADIPYVEVQALETYENHGDSLSIQPKRHSGWIKNTKNILTVWQKVKKH